MMARWQRAEAPAVSSFLKSKAGGGGRQTAESTPNGISLSIKVSPPVPSHQTRNQTLKCWRLVDISLTPPPHPDSISKVITRMLLDGRCVKSFDNRQEPCLCVCVCLCQGLEVSLGGCSSGDIHWGRGRCLFETGSLAGT